jgi:hypothetical protein
MTFICLLCFIISLYYKYCKKVRQFYYEKDPLYDHQLAEYLYSNEEAYKKLQDILNKKIERFSCFKYLFLVL